MNGVQLRWLCCGAQFDGNLCSVKNLQWSARASSKGSNKAQHIPSPVRFGVAGLPTVPSTLALLRAPGVNPLEPVRASLLLGRVVDARSVCASPGGAQPRSCRQQRRLCVHRRAMVSLAWRFPSGFGPAVSPSRSALFGGSAQLSSTRSDGSAGGGGSLVTDTALRFASAIVAGCDSGDVRSWKHGGLQATSLSAAVTTDVRGGPAQCTAFEKGLPN